MKSGYPHASAWYCRMAVGSGLLLLSAVTAWADNPPAKDQIDIGIFTAVEGKVAVTHPGLLQAITAKIQEGVLFKDVIETDKESRTKALLNDDSILTVGEHSRVEITEHIYDPNKGVRSVVLNLVKGKVRALVGKAFAGSGSKFEIHTPTAVAAARGTYFIVFHINGVSGISNIGTHGHVDFSSGGRTVPVPPGHFSFTPPGGGPPASPAVNTGSNVPSQVANAVQGTEVKDSPKEESPKQMALASGGTAPVLAPSSLTPPGISGPGGSSQSGGSSPSSGPTGPTVVGSGAPTVIIPIVTAAPLITEQTNPQPPPQPPPPPPPPPPPAEPPPPPPPHTEIDGWFAKMITRLFGQFDNTVEKAAQQEDKAIAKAESVYEQRIRSAEAEEAERIKQALEQEKKSIAQAEEEYKKTVANITTTDSALLTSAEQNLANVQATDGAAVTAAQQNLTTVQNADTALIKSAEQNLTNVQNADAALITSTQQGLADVNAQIAETQKQIADLQKKIADLNKNPSGGKGDDNRNEKGDTNEGEHRGQLQRLQTDLDTANTKLRQLQQTATTTQAQLEAANLKLQQDVKTAQAQLDAAKLKLQQDIKAAQAQVDAAKLQLQQDTAKLQTQLDAIKAQLKQDLAKVEEKLQADLKRAASLENAKEERAKAIEAAKNAKAALIEQARIARAQAREIAKVDRSGVKFIQRLSKTGDQYLAKLQSAGASQAEIDEARRQIAKVLSDAEAKVKLAQQNAVQDDIVRKTGQITEQQNFMRKLGERTRIVQREGGRERERVRKFERTRDNQREFVRERERLNRK